MKVQLKILSQNRGVMRVEVYKVSADSRVLIRTESGLIPEIKKALEDRFCEDIEIEKSLFEGWY
jgi:hypothetical protein